MYAPAQFDNVEPVKDEERALNAAQLAERDRLTVDKTSVTLGADGQLTVGATIACGAVMWSGALTISLGPFVGGGINAAPQGSW